VVDSYIQASSIEPGPVAELAASDKEASCSVLTDTHIFQLLVFNSSAISFIKELGHRITQQSSDDWKTAVTLPMAQHDYGEIQCSLLWRESTDWFLPCCMECRHGLTMRFLSVCPSVCPYVCLSNACIVTKWKKDMFRFLYHTKEHFS